MHAHAVVLLVSLLSSGALAAAGPGRFHRRSLVQSPSTIPAVIYNDGLLEWKSWSWGTSYMNVRDTGNPVPGSRSSLCFQVQPFGALSLKSNMPFSLTDGVLGFYLRSSPPSPTQNGYPVGELELQFESSSPSQYTVTPSITLRELALSQLKGNATAADGLLSAVQAGQWAAFKINLSQFKAAGKFDRMTLGSCLQNTDVCNNEDLPALPLCLDHVVLVSPAT